MSEKIQTLRDSEGMRWTALLLLAFGMFCSYIFMDILSPIKDFQKLEQRDMRTGEVTKLDMSTTSNVLQYFTEDGTKVSIRPSSTEPKKVLHGGA